MKNSLKAASLAMVASLALGAAPAAAQTTAKKPNILVIWGDDIGISNISHNTRGLMGYETPNIDRIAKEGIAFNSYYGQQSCTAGRAAFISGSVPLRSGMTKVGTAGRVQGWQKTDVTMATVLKSLGYATGQFGKNHEGDRDEHLPTMHGFDEFLGNLYHLNAEEEPENEDWPTDPEFRKTTARAASSPRRRQGRADDRGHRPPHEEADGDDRRRDGGRGHRVHQAPARGREALLRLVERHAHALPYARQGGAPRPVRQGGTSTRTGWSSTTCTSASC